VFHRPQASWRLAGLRAWLRQHGTRTVADVDDLVFNPSLAGFSPGVANGLVSLRTTTNQFQAHQRALARFDLITVSTAPLMAHAVALFAQAQVAVVPNSVPWRWRDMPANPMPRQPGLLTYLPGTRSHDRDFAGVAGALSRVLARHPQAHLRVTGPLNFALEARPGQVSRQEKLPFDKFHTALQSASVNLAPLEDTPFTRCKSAIKVMEAAWWNIPTVCSNWPDVRRFAQAGAVVANTEAEFETNLERLLTDEAHHTAVCEGLRARLLPLADVHQVAHGWLSFVLGHGLGAGE
jgi:glycosyltransferase involved in cell wall biosynthesis